ncbi:MAG: hypothetical protein AAF492_00115 [Verrucomicrobiota bacterium]
MEIIEGHSQELVHVEEVEEVLSSLGSTSTIPLSIGASKIRIECWAQLGSSIVTREYNAPACTPSP